jgi:DnaD/phage-associated family protein
MSPFSGFIDSKHKPTPMPAQFFSELLLQIDHLAELKVTLYAIWRLDHMQGNFRCLVAEDFLVDELFMGAIASRPAEAQAVLADALERAVLRGTLLRASLESEQEEQVLYFLNSTKGRLALDAIQQGKWRPPALPPAPFTLEMTRPNIFQLYEAHIGPLTPMVAEALRDAEQLYPEDWIEEALRIAAERNIRSWRYVQAILRSWKEKGRDEQDRKDSQADRRKYSEGEFADFIEH